MVIGGGTGTFTVLTGLKSYPVELSAIVAMADDGGSTGILRDEYGALPPGDVRRALVALSESSQVLRDLFNYRFREGGLRGHSFGNIFITGLEKVTGNFASAVREASHILNINGEVVPVTLDNVRLFARLQDGRVLRGENAIDIPREEARAAVAEVWLEPTARINPSVKRVLHSADLVVLGPGDLYTSIVPNLLVKGVAESIRNSKAKKAYVVNIMTKFGETQGYNAEDFVATIERYLGKNSLDYVLLNDRAPSAAVRARYRREKKEFVPPVLKPRKNRKPACIRADLLDGGKLVRHSPQKLARALMDLL